MEKKFGIMDPLYEQRAVEIKRLREENEGLKRINQIKEERITILTEANVHLRRNELHNRNRILSFHEEIHELHTQLSEAIEENIFLKETISWLTGAYDYLFFKLQWLWDSWDQHIDSFAHFIARNFNN